MVGERHGRDMGTVCYVWIGLYRIMECVYVRMYVCMYICKYVGKPGFCIMTLRTMWKWEGSFKFLSLNPEGNDAFYLLGMWSSGPHSWSTLRGKLKYPAPAEKRNWAIRNAELNDVLICEYVNISQWIGNMETYKPKSLSTQYVYVAVEVNFTGNIIEWGKDSNKRRQCKCNVTLMCVRITIVVV